MSMEEVSMAKHETNLFICDRCSKSEFVKNSMKQISPEGWSNVNGKDLCPSCSRAFASFMSNSEEGKKDA